MATPTTYQLACELRGHEEDVRGICVIDDAAIATSSRDKTVKLWRRDPNQPLRQQQQQDGGGFTVDKTFVGHTGFVGPVARLQPSDDQHPLGALVSGGMDARVVVWDVAKGEAERELVGHGGQVTGLAVTPTGDVISTSVDKTLRVWHGGKCSEVLEGHESSVLCALALPNGDIVSGSGDCTLKWWRGGACVRTVKAHSDTVRGVAEMPGVGLLSASHDGSVKLWDAEGGLLLEMVGHTALVYSVAASAAAADSQGGIGLVASGSEDGTARVWRNGECVQVLEHPGCVWAVAFLPNGDLVTACGDGVARVWTMSVDTVAAADVREGYEALIKAQRRSRTVGGVKVEDLPGPEALQEPGRKNGQTRIVREGDVGVAYSWNAKEYNWDKIGEVVDGPSEPTDSRTINGVTYDYVFDVDIGDGVPVRKLPYNHGQNPYEVADRWLLEQDLPLSYREQVVGFILQNTGTGGGGGGAATSASPFGNTIPDPYTGGQAYVPGAPPPGRAAAGAVGAPASAPTAVQPSFPKKGMLVFDTAHYDGILKKLREFNASLQGDASTAALSLGLGDMARMEAVVATLKDTSHYHSSTFAPADVALVSKLLSAWPAANLFPVLDVLRLMLLHPSAASLISADINSGSTGATDVLLGAVRRAGGGEPPVTANQLTGLRVAVNTFRHLTHFKSWLLQHRMEIVDMFAGCASSTNKNLKLAFTTLLLNFSVLLVDSKDEDGQIQVLSAAFEAAGASSDVDSTARQRALLAIATLMHSGTVRQVALDLDAGGIIAGACSSADATVAALGREMQTLLR